MKITAIALFVLLTTLVGCSDRAPTDNESARGAQASDQRPFTLGPVERLDGVRFVSIPVVSERDDSPYSSFASGSPRSLEYNRLIVDERSLSSRTILADDSRQIVNWRSFTDLARADDGAKPKRPPPSAAGHNVYAAVVKQERTRNSRDDEPVDLLLGTLEPARQRVVQTGLKRVLDVWLTTDGALAAVVQTATGTKVQRYDAGTLELRNESTLR